MKKNDIRKEIQEIAPGLSQLPKHNPFEVPTNYFDVLPSQIDQKRNRPAIHTFFTVLNIIFQPRFVATGLTAVVLLLISYMLFLDPVMNSNNNLAQNDLELFDEQLAWYSEYQSDVYYELLYDTDPDIEMQLFADQNDQQEQTLEYLLQYKDYYMDDPLY